MAPLLPENWSPSAGEREVSAITDRQTPRGPHHPDTFGGQSAHGGGGACLQPGGPRASPPQWRHAVERCGLRCETVTVARTTVDGESFLRDDDDKDTYRGGAQWGRGRGQGMAARREKPTTPSDEKEAAP